MPDNYSMSFGPDSYSLRASALMSPDSGSIWSTPAGQGSLRTPDGEDHTDVCCSILPPTYQRKILDSYANQNDREISRIKLADMHAVRLRRKFEQRVEEGQQPLSLIGRVDKQAEVNLYVTDSEYKLPGTITITSKKEPTLEELLALTAAPKADQKEKEKAHKHRHKQHHKSSSRKDPALDLFKYESYYGLKNTLAFLLAVFQRRSYDNRGTDVRCTVDVVNDDGDPSTNNAFWNGRQMYIGMGDQDWFTRFSADIDILGHEFGHAVVQSISNLEYSGMSGAINEHYADILGIMVKQFYGGYPTRGTFEAAFKPEKRKAQTVVESNWKIGEEVLNDKGGTYALRDMENPGTAFVKHPVLGDDEQPNHMSGYVKLPDDIDYGGVHIYSGILNRAFVVAAKKLGGYTWDHVGKIWLEALKNLQPTATFKDLVQATLAAAPEGAQREAVRAGWTTVGLP